MHPVDKHIDIVYNKHTMYLHLSYTYVCLIITLLVKKSNTNAIHHAGSITFTLGLMLIFLDHFMHDGVREFFHLEKLDLEDNDVYHKVSQQITVCQF